MQSLEGPHFLGSPHLNAKEAWLPGVPLFDGVSPWQSSCLPYHPTALPLPRSYFPRLEMGRLRPQHLKARGRAHSDPGPSAGCGRKGERGGALPNPHCFLGLSP